MRTVVQRVQKGKVIVDQNVVGEIESGLLIFLGIGENDSQEDIKYLVDKIINLRIFSDENGDLNLSVLEQGGEILVVPQFTLYGDCHQGRRPSFTEAGNPEMAEKLYNKFVKEIKKSGLNIETGKFQTKMDVELTNDGPVTMLIDSNKNF